MTTPNNFDIESDSLWDLVIRRMRATGDQTMVVDEYDRAETFSSVARAAERVAAGLLALGITPGSTVSWQLPTRIDTIVLTLALSRLGVIQNPIIPIYRSREVGAMIRQCNSEWLITLDNFRGFDHRVMAEELRAASNDALKVLTIVDGLPEGDPCTLPAAPAGTDDVVRWIYTTSGTTSAPKGVCHTDSTLIAGGLSLADAVAARSTDIGTIVSPFAHIAGPDMMVASLASGMALVIMEIFDPAAAAAHLRHHNATLYGGSTVHYELLLAEQLKHRDGVLVPSLRAMVGGGASMREALFHRARAELGVPILHGYGMTECPMITLGRPDDTVEQLAGTAGRPVLGCEVQIRAEDGDVLPACADGRVWVRGPMLFKHYLDRGEIVEPFDDDGWYFTGDIGHLRPDGNLTLVGREKDLIIRKGESMSPMEIEDVVAQHEAVSDVAVIGLPDEARGERICAVIELHPAATQPDLAQIREHCRRAGLSPNKSPEQIEIISEMPKTPTMKTRKQELRSTFSAASPS
ncbi:hypothetical protein B2J88_13075 [Rhodococcus sp. SRB_17]|nr:hypothetical protein [Rhodococcus sp. SRB_17]